MPLASIQRVAEIRPIPNADKIEVAKVLGWEVVVKKDEFKVGDLCVYIEIDTLIPRASWSEFLFKHPEETVCRLKTIKLRGQISQGLVIPLFDHWVEYNMYNKLGQDVTDIIGVVKYEKPQPQGYNPKSGKLPPPRNFPTFLRKTDEVRIQSAPELLEQLKGKQFYITQKMDGTSATYFKYNNKFGVCSRNLMLSDPRTVSGFWNLLLFKIRKLLGRVRKEIPNLDVYWKMAFQYSIESWLPEGYAIQGEICGPGIQGNKIGLPDTVLYVFNLWNIREQRYENPFTLVNIRSNVPLVPIIEYAGTFNMTMEELLEKAQQYVYPNNTPAEGMVVDNTIITSSL